MNNRMAKHIYWLMFLSLVLMASCRSTRRIQTAIAKRDSTAAVSNPPLPEKNDTTQLIRAALQQLESNRIRFTTFSAKVNVDYKGGDGKSYNVNAVVRMYKDSAIWISVNALLGIEAMRVLITRDSVHLLDKLNKTYTARSVDYLQDVTALPLDLPTLQDLIAGNPVFLDPNIVSYSVASDVISMMSTGQWFKHLITLNRSDMTLQHSKLDDRDMVRNRTADLTYSDYEHQNGMAFATKRKITVAEKKMLDIKMDFKQYDFDKDVSFPFSVPKNYERN